MPSDNEYTNIGIIGLTNLSILLLITLWRTFRFLYQQPIDTWSSHLFIKKLFFHIMLLGSTAVELPMYIAFIVSHRYTLVTYSFHKLASACLFTAFSITISDWAGLLYDIQEYKLYPFLLRRATLVTITLLYVLVSVVNFIFCFTLDDFGAYTSSTEYIVGVFFQIAIEVILTAFMLSSGLKLAWRIRGAAGKLTTDISQHNNGDNRANYSGDSNYRADPSKSSEQESSNSSNNRNKMPKIDAQVEFRNALWNLNSVMAACSICIILQATMLILDYSLGYVQSTSKTVGPTLFYWISYSWLPLWGVVISLLYLARTHAKHSNGQQNSSSRAFSYAGSFTSQFSNPLMGHYEEEEVGDTEAGTSIRSVRDTYHTIDSQYSSHRNNQSDTGSFDSNSLSPNSSMRHTISPKNSSIGPFGSNYSKRSGNKDTLSAGGSNLSQASDAFFEGDIYSPDNSVTMRDTMSTALPSELYYTDVHAAATRGLLSNEDGAHDNN